MIGKSGSRLSDKIVLERSYGGISLADDALREFGGQP